MAYIVQRKDRFYVVDYDGLDPLTGKERRRWHPAGHDRHEAEQMAARIERDAVGSAPTRGGPVHLGEFLTDTWLPIKRRHVRATTSYRYSPHSSPRLARSGCTPRCTSRRAPACAAVRSPGSSGRTSTE